MLFRSNLNDNEKVVEDFIQYLPTKVDRLASTADYGSWLNFFLCEAKGKISITGIGDAPLSLPLLPANRERCLS